MTRSVAPRVPVSWGELLDKLTILAIKLERIADPAARANVAREHDALTVVAAPALADLKAAGFFAELRRINAQLWDVENAIREHEAAGSFGDTFVRLARAVYHTNDERARVKRAINDRLGSELVEEKSYAGGINPAAR